VVKDETHKPKHILGPKKLITEHEEAILLTNAESHRFAITLHKKKRNKAFLKK
jgi:excinuclease UvrABC nuclease subunit